MGLEKEPNLKQNPKKRLVLNPSGKLLSKIMPWHVGLAIIEPIIKWLDPPQKLIGPYVKKGQVVADLGCGRGSYSLALAESVGPAGKVYAVDLDKKNIRVLQKRADKLGYQNIEAHAASAADLSFIKKGSVDFILANGLL